MHSHPVSGIESLRLIRYSDLIRKTVGDCLQPSGYFVTDRSLLGSIAGEDHRIVAILDTSLRYLAIGRSNQNGQLLRGPNFHRLGDNDTESRDNHTLWIGFDLLRGECDDLPVLGGALCPRPLREA